MGVPVRGWRPDPGQAVRNVVNRCRQNTGEINVCRSRIPTRADRAAQAAPSVLARPMDTQETAQPRDTLDLVVFDFDGTLTTEDTFVGFMKHDMGTARWLARMVPLLPTFAAYKAGRIDRHAVKHAVVRAVFTGRHIADVEASAKDYAQTVIPKLIRPAGMERFRRRWSESKAGGPQVVVCSASISPYLESFFAEFEGLDIVSCRLATDSSGICTGGLDGMNVWGPQKMSALRERYPVHNLNIVEAYGDSEGDRALLDAAERPFWRPFRGVGES